MKETATRGKLGGDLNHQNVRTVQFMLCSEVFCSQ